MLGESLQGFISKNKKDKEKEAMGYLSQLRNFSKEEILENPWQYLEVLTLLLRIINDNCPLSKISLEDIGTTEKEIKHFEEQSLIIESKTF